MKNKIAVLCLIPLLVFGTLGITGCKTTGHQENQNVINVGTTALRIAAKQGALYSIKQKPASRAYFELSVVAIDTLALSKNVDIVALRHSLDNIPVGEIKNDAQVKSVIVDVTEIYASAVGVTVSNKLDQVEYLVPALTAISTGFKQALEITK